MHSYLTLLTSAHRVSRRHRPYVRKILNAYSSYVKYTEDRGLFSSRFIITGRTADVARIRALLRQVGA